MHALAPGPWHPPRCVLRADALVWGRGRYRLTVPFGTAGADQPGGGPCVPPREAGIRGPRLGQDCHPLWRAQVRSGAVPADGAAMRPSCEGRRAPARAQEAGRLCSRLHVAPLAHHGPLCAAPCSPRRLGVQPECAAQEVLDADQEAGGGGGQRSRGHGADRWLRGWGCGWGRGRPAGCVVPAGRHRLPPPGRGRLLGIALALGCLSAARSPGRCPARLRPTTCRPPAPAPGPACPLAAVVDPNKRPRADRKLWTDEETQELMRLATVRREGGCDCWAAVCLWLLLCRLGGGALLCTLACGSLSSTLYRCLEMHLFTALPSPPHVPPHAVPRLLYRLQDSTYRAQLLPLDESAGDAEMWEAISTHFACTCVAPLSAPSAAVGCMRRRHLWLALRPTTWAAAPACQPGPASPRRSTHPLPACLRASFLSCCRSVQTAKRKYRHSLEALNNGTLGAEKGEQSRAGRGRRPPRCRAGPVLPNLHSALPWCRSSQPLAFVEAYAPQHARARTSTTTINTHWLTPLRAPWVPALPAGKRQHHRKSTPYRWMIVSALSELPNNQVGAGWRRWEGGFPLLWA